MFENEISKVLVSLQAIDKNKLKEIEIKEDIKFFYRGTNLSDDLIIISAKLKGCISDKNIIEQKQLNFKEIKKKFSQVKLKLVEVHLKILTKILKRGC